MPKIFEYFGFVFFFYSNEHEPIHVHVVKADKELIFELIMENGSLKEIRTRHSERPELDAKDAATAGAFINKYHKEIIDKWVEFFVLKKAVKSTKISKKI